jgi:hypothetical protein
VALIASYTRVLLPVWQLFILQFSASGAFHEYLPGDDPAGSKLVENIHNKQILIE